MAALFVLRYNKSQVIHMRKNPRLAVQLDSCTAIEKSAFHQVFDAQYSELEINEDLSEMEFNGCLFEKVSLNQHDFDHSTLIDCVFDHCDLSNVDLSNSCLRRVEFRQCNLVGIDLSRCVMEDVLIERCNARLSNCSGSQIKNCEWKESRFDEASFNDVRFKDQKLMDCSFVCAEFLHTPLSKLDFSDSTIEGIALSGTELKGVIVSPLQAVSLARLLGIVIKE